MKVETESYKDTGKNFLLVLDKSYQSTKQIKSEALHISLKLQRRSEPEHSFAHSQLKGLQLGAYSFC
jgi:hypothetical protein